MEKISVALDERQLARLEKLAAAEGKTVSEKLTEITLQAIEAKSNEK